MLESKTRVAKTSSGGTIRKIVYDEIRQYKDGITKDTLVKATGLELRQVSNALYKLSKKKLIHSIKRGIYVVL